MALRTRLLRLPYGDQALFVRRRTLQAVAGFSDARVLEDVDLVRRLNGAAGRPLVLPEPTITSGRRYSAGGFWRTVAAHQVLLAAWAMGAPQSALEAAHDVLLSQRRQNCGTS